MRPRFEERIDYGRAIRDRALCFVEAHGARAPAVLAEAVCDAGLPEVERLFLEAVAARVARLSARRPRFG
jgi:hypothetical protein